MINPKTCLFLLFALPFLGCHRGSGGAETRPPTLDGDRIQFQADAPELSSLSVQPVENREALRARFTGRLVWDENATVRIFSPVLGRVSRIVTDVGQALPSGMPLALIESPDFGQAQAEAARSQADLKTAIRNLERAKALVENGAAARKELDNAEADHMRALAESQRTQARLTLFGGKGSGVDQQYMLRSPISGFVVDRSVNPGQEVRPDATIPLFVVSDPHHLWVVLDIGEGEVSGLKPGRDLIIRSKAYPDQEFRGSLTVVGDTLDPTTRTLKVRGLVTNPKRLLRAEMYVDVELDGQGERRLPFVPASATVADGSRTLVFVEEAPGRFRRQAVRLGAERNGRVEVIEGLTSNSRVVTEGGLLLQSLMKP
jgi:cobalt-zinc-cadmium efflux system membrane fusion protein